MAGKKGRSGRHSFELTLRAQAIVERAKLLEEAEQIATNKALAPSDRLHAIRFLVEYGFGKANQPVSTPPGTSFTLKFGADADDA